MRRDLTPAAPAYPFVPVDPAVRERSISERFRAQVAVHGERTVVRTAGASISYAALGRLTAEIAAQICERVGGPGERVALLIDDPILQVAALLAVLEAGHAFVPLDLGHPPARLATVVADCDPRLLLTDDAHEDMAHAIGGGRACSIVSATGADSRFRGWQPPKVVATAPASLIYTSGSTGAPKGVVHTHRSILHAFMNHTNTLRVSAEDRLTLLGSYAFAGTLSDVFGALLSGAALLSYRVDRDGIGGLEDWLARERATIYFSVPTVFRLLTDAMVPGRLDHLRIVRLGGEPVRRSDVERFRRRFGRSSVLVNILGCSEVSCIRTHLVTHDTPVGDGALAVGHAPPGTEVVLLDESGRPLGPGQTGPIGVIGEIAVRSRYLATGYWRQPELTGARFSPGAPEDERLFRTGDLGRIAADGLLEHLGRRDSQVKIGGVRVEPAEVESVLIDEGLAREAVVMARATAHGEPRLVAYLVPAQARVGAAAVRRRLGERLPPQMVPTAIVELERLPLGDHGKVDRRALPPPEPGREGAGSPVAARDALEEMLVAIWRGVLGLARLGVTDDFFALGGDSLAALAVCLRIDELTGARLSPADLLEFRTVAELARRIQSDKGSRPWPTLVPLQPAGTRAPFFCVHPRPGGVICYAELARRLGPELPFYALQARGLDGRTAPPRGLDEIVEHYLAKVRAVQPRGPYHLGGWCVGGLIAFEMAQRLRARGQVAALVVLCDTYFPRRGETRVRAELARLSDPTGLVESAGWAVGAARDRLRHRVGKHAPLAEAAYRVGRTMDEILRRYRPQPYDGKLLIIESRDPAPERRLGPAREWLRVAVGERDLVRLDLGHQDMLIEPGVQQVAELFGRHLTAAPMSPPWRAEPHAE